MARVLITGGAGFIGSNLADRLLGEGHEVTLYDAFVRPGVERNVTWLAERHGDGAFRVVRGDVVDFEPLLEATRGVQRVYHLAGQVAVTSSVEDPRADFQANALGTFNALEAARQAGDDPVFLYSSTNKVYGGLEGVAVAERGGRYVLPDLPLGVPETFPLDFHSPYGCSKGAGDQYVRDYARIYGLRSVVLRQSCIYGYRQFGVEDQGWMAWFIIAAELGRPITIYGDGKQVRDVLFVTDLLDAYEAAVQHIGRAAGRVYNIGGGPERTLSVWSEFGPLLASRLERPLDVSFGAWRAGDQRVYVSDIRRAADDLAWTPRVGVEEGVDRLFAWVRENRHYFG